MGFIYMLISPSNKKYIGQTVRTIEERFLQHKNRAKVNDSRGCVALNAAIRKYGFNKFTISILLEINDEFLDENEIKFIETHDSMAPNGYNLTIGGRTTKYSEISKQKMSETQKNLYQASDVMRKQIQMNGFNRKVNKDLPMYLTEEKDKNGEIIGYRIFCHPVNPKAKKFCCKKDLPSAYKRASEYLESLNELQNMCAVQRLNGSGS